MFKAHDDTEEKEKLFKLGNQPIEIVANKVYLGRVMTQSIKRWQQPTRSNSQAIAAAIKSPPSH